MNVGEIGIKQRVSFKGLSRDTDSKGMERLHFYLPPGAAQNYDVKLQLVPLVRETDGWQRDKDAAIIENDLPEGGLLLDPNDKNLSELSDKKIEALGYRYALTPKNGDSRFGETKGLKYINDAGYYTNILSSEPESEKFNILSLGRAVLTQNGPMTLVFPDTVQPHKFDANGNVVPDLKAIEKSQKTIRTHSNMMGGNFAGIIAILPELKEQGIKRIVLNPFTRDNLSSHKYWTENAYQVSTGFGDMKAFKKMMTAFFKNGMNPIMDAALVNQSLQGIHFSHFIKWGERSPYKYFFNNVGLENGVNEPGVFPPVKEGTENFVGMKIINNPADKDYNPKRVTQAQIFDKRLASEKQQNDKFNPIDVYDKNNTDNIFEINDFNDTVTTNRNEIDPAAYFKNLKLLNAKLEPSKQYSKDNSVFTNYDHIKQLIKFESFKYNERKEGGYELWDGNVDIPKLKFYSGKDDEDKIAALPEHQRAKERELIQKNVFAVQDFAVNSGKYWARTTKNAQLEYAASLFKNVEPTVEAYKEQINKQEKNLPPSIKEVLPNNQVRNLLDDELIENVLTNKYNLKTLKEESANFEQNLLRSLMDCPFESFLCSTDLAGVLGSNFISKRAGTKDEILMSRLDVELVNENENVPEKFKSAYEKTNKIFKKEFFGLAKDIFDKINAQKQIYEPNKDFIQRNELGKYVIPLLIQDVFTFGLTKALKPDSKLETDPKTGEITYLNADEQDISLRSLGINASSPEEEANGVIEKLKAGLLQISDEDKQKLADSFVKRLEGLDANSFKMAEAIIDKTESGIGVRIDAAKDVASIDAVKHNTEDIDKLWDSVTEFWGHYTKAFLKENPHAYTNAEITDMDDFMKDGGSQVTKSANEALFNFIQKTGITTEANYSHLFGLPRYFGIEAGEPNGGDRNDIGNVKGLGQNLITSWDGGPGMFYYLPFDGVNNSYTFLGNHDKPRIFHTLALDMELFYSDFTKDRHRETAADVLGISADNTDFTKISPIAVAMGSRLKKAFKELNMSPEFDQAVTSAIKDMASGTYKGLKYNPAIFGTKPFDIIINCVLNQAEEHGLKLDKKEKTSIEGKVLKSVLEPALDRYMTLYKLLTVMPGSPTDFYGEKLGMSGYETKCKNWYQQNRAHVPVERLNTGLEQDEIINKIYNDTNNITTLRKDPKLSALNDGIPVILPFVIDNDNKKRDDVLAMYRYNNKGSNVITITTNDGVKHVNDAANKYDDNLDLDFTEKLKRTGTSLPYLVLSPCDNDGPVKIIREEKKIFKVKQNENGKEELEEKSKEYRSFPEIDNKGKKLEQTEKTIRNEENKTVTTFTYSSYEKNDHELFENKFDRKGVQSGLKEGMEFVKYDKNSAAKPAGVYVVEKVKALENAGKPTFVLKYYANEEDKNNKKSSDIRVEPEDFNTLILHSSTEPLKPVFSNTQKTVQNPSPYSEFKYQEPQQKLHTTA